MPTFDAGRFSGKTLEDVFDYLARFDRTLNYLLNGRLDSHNAFEFGGWRVNEDTLVSLSGNVGMSSAGALSTSVRFWAGNAVLGSAPFRVTEVGALFASNADIAGKVTATTGAIGGWVIGATSLTDVAGTVGMSSLVTGGDDIRFFAGNATPSSAPFRVTEAGVLTASSGTVGGWILGTTSLTSAAGYPKVELNNFDNLLGAYSSANDKLTISPFGIAGTPSLQLYNVDSATLSRGAVYITDITGVTYFTFFGREAVQITAPDVWINGPLRVNAFSDVTDGVSTLQALLNAKAAGSGINGTVYVASSSGGPVTTPITFTNGVRTA